MKGKNLVSLVLSLSKDEYDHIFQTLYARQVQSAQIFAAIRSVGSLNRKQISETSGVKERQIRVLLPKLSDSIIYELGTFEPDEHTELDAALLAAYKLVFRIENDPAAELLQDLYDKATEIERFDILPEVLRLTEIMTQPIQLNGLSKKEVTTKHLNLLQFRAIKERIEQLRQIPVAERLDQIADLIDSKLLSDENQALSMSAKAHFHWIWTRIHYFDENHFASCQSQKQLIKLLDEFSWLDRQHDFFFPNEHRLLTSLFVATGQNEAAYKMLFKVGNIDSNHQLTELTKWEQIYPLKLDAAIDAGDDAKGRDAVNEISKLFRSNSDLFPTKFITQNLYKCSYFYFTVGEFAKAQKLNLKLQTGYNSVDFYPMILPMVRIMATLIAFETGDQVEMGRQDKNFRMTSAYQETRYYKSVLGILKRLVNHSDPHFIDRSLTEFRETLKDKRSRITNRKFNFEVWLESKKCNCTMAEIFRRPAAPTTNIELEAI